MKILSKIKALFRFREQEDVVEMDLAAAEIKDGVVYLHPRDEKITYRIKTDDVSIILNNGQPLSPENISRMEPKERTSRHSEKDEDKNGGKKSGKEGQGAREGDAISPNEFDRFKKRKFVVSLYPEEYDVVMTSIKSYGYKRADFVMACVNSASKGTMEKAHKKIVKSHNEALRAQKALEAQRQEAIPG